MCSSVTSCPQGSSRNFDVLKFSSFDVSLGCRQDISHCPSRPEVAQIENGRPCYWHLWRTETKLSENFTCTKSPLSFLSVKIIVSMQTFESFPLISSCYSDEKRSFLRSLDSFFSYICIQWYRNKYLSGRVHGNSLRKKYTLLSLRNSSTLSLST